MLSAGGQPWSIGAADLAEVRAMRDGPAHGIDRRVADDQVEIGAVRPERIVTRRADLGTRLPPAVLAAHDPRIETLVQTDTGSHSTLWRLDSHPFSCMNAALGSG